MNEFAGRTPAPRAAADHAQPSTRARVVRHKARKPAAQLVPTFVLSQRPLRSPERLAGTDCLRVHRDQMPARLELRDRDFSTVRVDAGEVGQMVTVEATRALHGRDRVDALQQRHDLVYVLPRTRCVEAYGWLKAGAGR